MGRRLAVVGDDGPLVVEDVVGLIAQGDHRLDGQGGPDGGLRRAAAHAVVGDIGWQVHVLTDAVAGVVLDDAVVDTVGPGVGADRVLDATADVVEIATGAEGRDPGPHRATGHLGQPGGGGVAGRVTADHEGDGAVAVPPLDLGAAIDAQQVTLSQDALPRDAVDDLVPDGGAQRVRVARHELEVGDPAAAADEVLREGIQVRGRHTGARLGAQHLEGPSDEKARHAHRPELVRGARADPLAAEEGQVLRPRARRRSARRPRRPRPRRRRSRGDRAPRRRRTAAWSRGGRWPSAHG